MHLLLAQSEDFQQRSVSISGSLNRITTIGRLPFALITIAGEELNTKNASSVYRLKKSNTCVSGSLTRTHNNKALKTVRLGVSMRGTSSLHVVLIKERRLKTTNLLIG